MSSYKTRVGFWLMRFGASLAGLEHFGHHANGDVIVLSFANAAIKDITTTLAVPESR